MLERLSAVELAKQQVILGSAEFVSLAEEAYRLAQVATRWAERQVAMAHEAEQERTVDPATDVKLTDVQPRHLDRILADWREAELRLETADRGSIEAERAAADVERLRAEYHAADQRKRQR